jgi:DNA-binding Xre family transcriptional regulator
MKLEEAITKRIFNLCYKRNITPNKLASMAGLPSATIRCIFYGKSKNPGTRTLLDICQALDISLYDFFNDPLFQTKELEGSY